jgi:hypothetical protein
MTVDTNESVLAVVEAAHAAEPKLQATDDMAQTLVQARAWLAENEWQNVRVDRWTKNSLILELGYVHGEVWFRGWMAGAADIKIQEATRRTGDLTPLWRLIDEMMGWVK